MPSNPSQITNFLRPGRRLHLVGIGGVSMRALALVLHSMGMEISGSDMSDSPSVHDLRAQGIPVTIGHRGENIQGAEALIRTAAVHNDNPEIAAARALGTPIFERAQAWGHIMQSYRRAICVSGTHGKTTTTSMITHIFMEAQLDPTVMIGGNLPLLGAGHRVGGGDTIIMESCEYCNSFLNFYPTVAVILNIEADHLDFFKDLADIQRSFRTFSQLIPKDGLVISNGDDANTREALAGNPTRTFGFSEDCEVRAVNCSEDFRDFDVLCSGAPYGHFHLNVLGRHNVLNALAAAAVAWSCGIDAGTAARGIEGFHGAGRRMEYKGSYHGAQVYDDYAHHPGELRALLDAVETLPHKRILLAFQPHTYSRTYALFDQFVRELRRADIAILAEIYAAREQNTIGISSADLVRKVPGSIYCETLPEVTARLRELAREGDLILTVGAGDIYKAGEALLKQ